MRHRIHILFALAVLFGLFISCSQLGLKISFKDSLLSLHQDDIEAGSKLYTMKFNHEVDWVDNQTKTFTLTIDNSKYTNLDAKISSDKLKIYIMFLDQDINIKKDDDVTISFDGGILKHVNGNEITSPQTITKVAVNDETGPEVVPFEVVPFMNIILPPEPNEKTEVIVIFKESIKFYSDTIEEEINEYVTLTLNNTLLTIKGVSIPEGLGTPINNDRLVFIPYRPLDPGTLSVFIEKNVIKDLNSNPNKQISFEMGVFMLETVYVEGGSFQMGSTDRDADSDESPVHEVTVSSFSMAKREVTQGQWKAVMGDENNPSNWKGDDLPVERVTWYDAVAYCNALSAKEGLDKVYTINETAVTADFDKNGWRLPTEAEWEYASRGGKESEGYKYSGSDTVEDVGWYSGNSTSRTHSVSEKAANELGLYDMSGNVSEWCWDWYGNYSSGSQIDPRGPSSAPTGTRVRRGGSWNNNEARDLRSAKRGGLTPGRSYSDVGFRPVCLKQF